MHRARPSTLLASLLAALLLSGCGTTVTLKQPPGAGAPAPAAASAPGGTTAAPADNPSSNPSSRAPKAAQAAQATPAATGIRVASKPRSSAPTFRDRFSSGLHTGTVGAAFGGLGGPIGMAAGGGAGFLAGFLAGRPVFGGGGGIAPGPGGSWEREVEEQQDWEAQVAARVEQLDGGVQPAASGIGGPAPPAAYPAATGAPRAAGALPDPLEDYESWSQQIMEHAASPAVRARAGGEAARADAGAAAAEAAGGEADGVPADADLLAILRGAKPPAEDWTLRALDADDDGRADAWFGYEGEVLRRHAMDRDGDGRPDRLDVYEGEEVAERHLDDDGDGRFERRDRIAEGRITATMIDQNGDGRFETLTLPQAAVSPSSAGEKGP